MALDQTQIDLIEDSFAELKTAPKRRSVAIYEVLSFPCT